MGSSLREVRAAEGSEQTGASFWPQPTLYPGHIPYFPFPVIVTCLCGCLFSLPLRQRADSSGRKRPHPAHKGLRRARLPQPPPVVCRVPVAKVKPFPSGMTSAPKDPGWEVTQLPPQIRVTSVRCLDPHPPQSLVPPPESGNFTSKRSWRQGDNGQGRWKGKKGGKCQALDGCALNSVLPSI